MIFPPHLLLGRRQVLVMSWKAPDGEDQRGQASLIDLWAVEWYCFGYLSREEP